MTGSLVEKISEDEEDGGEDGDILRMQFPILVVLDSWNARAKCSYYLMERDISYVPRKCVCLDLRESDNSFGFLTPSKYFWKYRIP